MNDRQAEKWAKTRSKGPLRFISMLTLYMATCFTVYGIIVDSFTTNEVSFHETIRRFPILFPLAAIVLVASGGYVLWAYGEWQFKRYQRRRQSDL